MKKTILTIILTTLIVGCIGVYAGTKISATEVSYDEHTTVKEKLDDIYAKKNNVNVWNNGNPLNLTLYNGCEIKKDEQNDYYLSFDGVDDYAQLDTLPATIDWSDGITVEFTAKWDAFNEWSRIFDFGNAETDAIVIGNEHTSNKLAFLVEDGRNQYYAYNIFSN